MANVVNDNMYNQLVQLYNGDTKKADDYKKKVELGYSTDDFNKLSANLNKLYGSSTTTSNTPANTNNTSTKTNITPTTYTNTNNKTNSTPVSTSTKTQTYTNTPASTPISTTTPTTAGGTDYNKVVREGWDKKSYQEQQDLLNKNPWLKEQIVKAGGTFKTADTTTATPAKTDVGTTTVKPGSEWDYQDNSPERMAQMVDNLERIYLSNPGLFDNEQTFKDYFINGVNRSPEQAAFLMDYFKNRQIYNEYDGYTAEKVGYMEAHGQCPQSYLNYVKNSNPQRYAEIMDSKDKTEKGIENDTYYSDLLKNSGFEDSSNLAWQKKEGLLVDENGDLIDDRMYHEMSAEERQYRDEINTIQAQNLKLEETLRYMDEDLIDQYPDADYSTIMLLRSDRGSKIQKEIASNNVTLTKLQGTVDYMQSERQQQDKAGQQTIANLQKNLGMYYDYSPEGMSELAQAQYAATNVTLDQADNGTDTQKQMALDSVLSDYFDKYGSIIQRSKSQVINDVMNYAKKNGVSLSQALEDNFLSQLRKKPGFAALNTVESKDPYVVKVGDVAYRYNPETDEFELIGGNGTIGGALGGGTTNGELYGFTNYTPITTEKKESTLSSFMSEHPLNSNGGECGSFVNDYLQSLGYNRLYDDPIDKKKAVTNSDTATVGSIAVLDSKKYPQYGHTAIITDVQGDKVKLLESNWNDDHQVHERWVNKSEILGYFDPSKEPTPATTTNQNSKYGNKSNWNPDGYSNNLIGEYEAYLADPTYENKSDYDYKLSQFGITFEDFTEQAKNYARTGMKDSQVDSASNALEAAINLYEYVNGNKSTLLGAKDSKQGGIFDWLGGYIPKLGGDAYDAKGYYDTLGDRLTLDKLIETKRQGATYGAMSEGEWKLLKNAATSLDWDSSGDKFQKNLEDLIWTLTRTVKQGGGTLPSNFTNSAASKYYLESEKTGKYNPYIKDNTPMNYDNNGGTPSRLS